MANNKGGELTFKTSGAINPKSNLPNTPQTSILKPDLIHPKSAKNTKKKVRDTASATSTSESDSTRDRDAKNCEKDAFKKRKFVRQLSGSSPDLSEKGSAKKPKGTKVDDIKTKLYSLQKASSLTEVDLTKTKGIPERNIVRPVTKSGLDAESGQQKLAVLDTIPTTTADKLILKVNIESQQQQLISQQDTLQSDYVKNTMTTPQQILQSSSEENAEFIKSRIQQTDMEVEPPQQKTPTSTAPEQSTLFKSPKKTIAIAQLFKTPDKSLLELRNRYEPLNQQNVDNEESQNSQSTIREKAKSGIRKPTEPKQRNIPAFCPPLVFKGIATSHTKLVAELNKCIKKGFFIKYARRTTLVYIKDQNEYKTYKNSLAQQGEAEFHTYTLKEEKTHAFVLRGLQGEITVEDIKDELETEYDLTIKFIYRMKTKQVPLYLIITNDTITLKMLQQQIKYISNTKVSWERRINDRLISQCRRCQAWGHGTSNCYKTPRCLKCADTHWTRDCEKPPNLPPTCANCRGEHTASSTECPIYVRRIEGLQQQREADNTEQRYIPAPPPAVNAWEARTKATNPSPPNTDFPPLPSTAASPPFPQSAAPPRSRQINSSAAPAGEFSELLEVTNKLNTLIDVQETIRAIAALNNMLEGVKDPLQIITVMQNYTKNELPKYHIIPTP